MRVLGIENRLNVSLDYAFYENLNFYKQPRIMNETNIKQISFNLYLFFFTDKFSKLSIFIGLIISKD